MSHLDPENINVPAYLRKKTLVRQSKQKLILTALDRKEARLPHDSTRALAPVRTPIAPTKNVQKPTRKKNSLFGNVLNQRISRDHSIRSTTPRTISRPDFSSSISVRTTEQSQSRSPFEFPETFASAQISPQESSSQKTSLENEPQYPQKLCVIGTVTHYLPKIDVAIIKLTVSLSIGDHIYLPTDEGISLQQVEEMQIDRRPILRAQAGDHIGLKVSEKVMVDERVYKV